MSTNTSKNFSCQYLKILAISISTHKSIIMIQLMRIIKGRERIRKEKQNKNKSSQYFNRIIYSTRN